ncbi:DUF3768 domain-containing protein [Sphingomonas sp. GC_Shp_4]|uniref:DUF3768 domain-containing protein n=1 Tax=Sphingomonas sp. GC_Shp_4 TaxID=2937382 RepID=UPI00226BA286|nr:DUF3768 domain-containing protein [Sphingomonas sp. GC_Shp_4]
MNDAFRRNPSRGQMMATVGVVALGSGALPAVLQLVREYSDFTANNDPYGEHDLGTMTWNGAKLFWKIDYYDVDLRFASPDPTDPLVTVRMLTIMLSEEW